MDNQQDKDKDLSDDDLKGVAGGGGRPPVEGGRPPVEGGRPPVEGGRPPVEGGRPPVD